MPATVGYVPERLASRSRLTGAEYVAHMGRIKGLDPGTISSRSRELFERLDLQPGPSAMVDALSKGNRQKLIVAQAFLGPVGLLVLDEPYSGLDTAAHRSLGKLMDEAQALGASVLISAHAAHSTPRADRVVHIGDGHLQAAPGPRPSLSALDSSEQRIELVATANGCDPDQIATLPGVLSTQRDPLGVAITLVVAHLHVDAVLSAVISLGWSVVSVGSPGQSGTLL